MTEEQGTIGRRADVGPAALAVAWAMSHPAVTAPIIGARDLKQLEGSLAALEVDAGPSRRRLGAFADSRAGHGPHGNP